MGVIGLQRLPRVFDRVRKLGEFFINDVAGPDDDEGCLLYTSGSYAVELVEKRKFSCMVALRGTQMTAVPIEAVSYTHLLPCRVHRRLRGRGGGLPEPGGKEVSRFFARKSGQILPHAVFPAFFRRGFGIEESHEERFLQTGHR